MTPPPISSPCRKVCVIGGDGLCDGCGRTLAEVASWRSFAPEQRERVMRRVATWSVRAPDESEGRQAS
ncbi:MAG: DUF1289 domain-containing protein [Gemmatimonadaceae bacterium]|jgi:hypothetical protein|nr:DUF1289 domain-containing protein [Gemmatimonadaceae bacterium]